VKKEYIPELSAVEIIIARKEEWKKRNYDERKKKG
jgi:hypothetical protein